MTNKLIYLVEDERDIRELASRALKEYGYIVEGFHNGSSARNAIKRCRPDLVICDLGLPDMDGMSLVRELWDKNNIGVIILTGRSSLSDRVLGLEVGADDYVTKPFEPRELVARTASLFRRLELATQQENSSGKKAFFSGYIYCPDSLTLQSPDGKTETLSSTESQLIMTFLQAPNRVLSRDQLLEVHTRNPDQSFYRSIDVRVSRLRNKLNAETNTSQLINTVYGAGYLFSSSVEWTNE